MNKNEHNRNEEDDNCSVLSLSLDIHSSIFLIDRPMKLYDQNRLVGELQSRKKQRRKRDKWE